MPREPRHVKVTQEQYFEAAFAFLSESGPESVTISRLCGRLGVTSGSFYHYFGSMVGFVDALLEYWEADRTQRIVAVAASRESGEQRIDFMREMAIDLPHEAESAIRAWSRSDERVLGVLQRVDTGRHTTLHSIILELGVAPDCASRLATMGLALLVGVQQLQHPVDRELLRSVFDEYQQTIFRHRHISVAASAGEDARSTSTGLRRSPTGQ